MRIQGFAVAAADRFSRFSGPETLGFPWISRHSKIEAKQAAVDWDTAKRNLQSIRDKILNVLG